MLSLEYYAIVTLLVCMCLVYVFLMCWLYPSVLYVAEQHENRASCSFNLTSYTPDDGQLS
jgi:hypothetical protein